MRRLKLVCMIFISSLAFWSFKPWSNSSDASCIEDAVNVMFVEDQTRKKLNVG